MKTVITYGTFDLFHIGHLRLLQRAKALGDRLIVGVSTDEFNLQKGKKAIMPFEHRAEIVRSIKYVDLVIPETCWEQKVEDIKKYNVDILVMGDDWKGKFDHLSKYCEVVYLPRTEGISSTELREILKKFSNDQAKALSAILQNLKEIDVNTVIRALNILIEFKNILM
ncbi:MAG: glycerol-3-phosphate cytidylyltransferase [Petrotoga sp.]|jgi:glycerol-3-phosphate cytidylyltransferase|nr:glycerol-3-phosphate cytidylyltransferase [Petrotoga sp.]